MAAGVFPEAVPIRDNGLIGLMLQGHGGTQVQGKSVGWLNVFRVRRQP